MILRLCLFVTCLVVSSLALKSNWNQEMRDHVLKIHNDYRRGEGGCQMNKLVYNMALEQHAKWWAEKCVFKHEYGDYGENLAWDSNHNPEKDLIAGSAKRWFDEKYQYSYGQYSCGSLCHYTQMVWDSTERVGCYTTRCPDLINAYRDAWYLVCFYTPKGNWIGEKPYELTCDSACKAGQRLDDGLCVGAAGGGGSDQGGEKCEDKKESCEAWAERGECERNPEYLHKHCEKSCKICESKEGEKTSTGGEGSETGSESGGSDGSEQKGGKCKDETENCEMWAERGECGRNPSYMHKHCEKSCKICESEEGEKTSTGGEGSETGSESGGGDGSEQKGEKCKDENENCETWAERGECERNPSYMHEHCEKSCKICESEEGEKTSTGGEGSETGSESGGGSKPVGGKCEDKHENCETWAENGECERNPSYMHEHCEKSCKICESEEGEKTSAGGEGSETGSESGGGDGTHQGGKACEDKHENCETWAKNNQCEEASDYMYKNCEKSCKICESEEKTNTCGEGGKTGSESGGDVGHDKKSDCADKNNNCAAWAAHRQCEKKPSYMLKHCQKSCGVC